MLQHKGARNRVEGDAPPTCRALRLSQINRRWLVVAVSNVGTFLLPQARTIGERFKVLRAQGSGATALRQCRVPRGPVYPGDFGLPYVIVETQGGVKRFYGAKDDLMSLLVL